MDTAQTGFPEERDFAPPAQSEPWIEPTGIARMSASFARANVVVVGPGPGYGKTSLLSHLYHASAMAKRSPLWISFSSTECSDVAALNRLILGAVRGCLGTDSLTLALAMGGSPLPPGLLLGILVEELTSRVGAVDIFLDDVDSLTREARMSVLQYLVDRASPTLRVHLSSRAPIDLSYSKIRARNELLELSALELRLHYDDVAKLVRSRVSERVPTDLIDGIYGLSEGWPAGVNLALQALKRSEPSLSSRAFMKRWRDIVERYFEDLCLHAFSSKEREALAVLGKFRVINDDVVATLGLVHAPAILELQSRGVLVERTVHRPQFFRMHASLADQLSVGNCPAVPDALIRKAALQLARNGFPTEAIEALFRFGDQSGVATVLEKFAQQILEFGDFRSVRAWHEALDAPLFRDRAKILIVFAWAHLFANDLDQATVLTRAAGSLKRADGDADDAWVASHLLGMQIACGALEDDLASVTRLVETWREKHASSADLWLTRHVSNALTYVNLSAGRYESARRGFPKARFHETSDGAGIPSIYYNCYVARSYLWEGNFDACRDHIDTAHDISDKLPRHLAAASYMPAALKGLVHFEFDELDAIELTLESRLFDILRTSTVQVVHDALVAVARMRCARGEYTRALDVLGQVSESFHGRPSAFRQCQFALEELRVRFAENDLRAAGEVDARIRRLVSGSLARDSFWKSHVAGLISASDGLLAFARADYGRASESLKSLVARLEGGGRRYSAAEARALLCASFWKDGKKSLAFREFGELTAYASKVGLRRTILDWRTALIPLMEAYIDAHSGGLQSADRVAELDYVEALLQGESNRLLPSPERETAVQRLTNRERELLSLVSSGYSNGEIAQALGLSINTVKWHLKNAYEKLDARGRVDAVRIYEAFT